MAVSMNPNTIGRKAVTSKVHPTSGSIAKVAKLTQAQYDALAVKDDDTLYVIVG